jgi:hypothetical protein
MVAVKGTGTNLKRTTAPIVEVKKNMINLISVRLSLTQTEASLDLDEAADALTGGGVLLRNVFLAID